MSLAFLLLPKYSSPFSLSHSLPDGVAAGLWLLSNLIPSCLHYPMVTAAKAASDTHTSQQTPPCRRVGGPVEPLYPRSSWLPCALPHCSACTCHSHWESPTGTKAPASPLSTAALAAHGSRRTTSLYSFTCTHLSVLPPHTVFISMHTSGKHPNVLTYQKGCGGFLHNGTSQMCPCLHENAESDPT